MHMEPESRGPHASGADVFTSRILISSLGLPKEQLTLNSEKFSEVFIEAAAFGDKGLFRMHPHEKSGDGSLFLSNT